MRLLGPLVAAVFTLGVASPAYAQHRVVEALLTSATPTGALPPLAVEAAMRGSLRGMEHCLRSPFRVGSAELHATLTVNNAGRVTRATLAPAPLPRAAMAGCLLAVWRATVFPAASAGTTVDAVFEINW